MIRRHLLVEHALAIPRMFSDHSGQPKESAITVSGIAITEAIEVAANHGVPPQELFARRHRFGVVKELQAGVDVAVFAIGVWENKPAEEAQQAPVALNNMCLAVRRVSSNCESEKLVT